MRLGWLVAPLALGACGGDPAPAPAPVEASPTAEAPAAPAAPSRQIGTTSALTGQTSALTGAISDFVVERTATETRVALAADTLFEFDKATLTPDAQANLNRTADLVRQGGEGPVRVVGHTDGKGDDAYNDSLSKRRAEAVAAWFKTQPGLGTRDFTTEGRGKREPIAPNTTADGADDPQGRARNRRVVVIIPR